MIALLTGKIISKQPPQLVLDVHGVGYEVFAPMSTFYQLQDPEQNVTLLIQMVVREDAMLLYGFLTSRERDLFRALVKVSGVGPKLALSILSGIEPDAFVHCVMHNETSRLHNIPGVGKKTAERLVIETRDALKKWQEKTLNASTTPSDAPPACDDAIEALIALGYKPTQAQVAIKKIQLQANTSEEMIRLALRQMVN